MVQRATQPESYFFSGHGFKSAPRRLHLRSLRKITLRRRTIGMERKSGEAARAPSDRSSSLELRVSTTDAWDDLLEILEAHWRSTGLGGVMHCFSGEWEQAERSLDLGFLLSFAGNLTYPKSQPLRDVAARLPLDRLLVETDAPWLAPVPNRGKRNEPAWVSLTARCLAGLRGVPEDEIAQATTKNFNQFFGLGSI
jgi:TatD family hydrolase